jgi:hypothetical protein
MLFCIADALFWLREPIHPIQQPGFDAAAGQ